MKSEFKMNFSVKLSVYDVIKIANLNCHLSKYYYKIPLNYTHCDFIYCPTTVLYGIYHNKYRVFEFEMFSWVTILFKPC